MHPCEEGVYAALGIYYTYNFGLLGQMKEAVRLQTQPSCHCSDGEGIVLMCGTEYSLNYTTNTMKTLTTRTCSLTDWSHYSIRTCNDAEMTSV